MLSLRLQNLQRLPVTAMSVEWEQNSINTFSVTVLLSMLSQAPADLINTSFTLYDDNGFVISGLAITYSYAISKDGAVSVTFSCHDELTRLADVRAYSDAHYQDQTLQFIVADLLATVGNWQLGNVSTMLDPLITTTIDLRSKETLWAQIIEAVESVPNVFVRYGGFDNTTSQFILDIGFFGETSPLRIVQNNNLLDLSLDMEFSKRYRTIEAYGGKSGDTVISLAHALAYDPTLDVATDYRIQTDVHNKYVVIDLSAPIGAASVLKNYQVVKTKNDGPPTDADLNEAGIALYRRVIKEFEKSVRQDTYTCKAIFPVEIFGPINNIPVVMDNIQIHGSVTEQAYNLHSGLYQPITTFSVDTSLRILKIALDYSENIATYTLTLSSGAYLQKENDAEYLVKLLESSDRYDEVDSSRTADLVIVSHHEGPNVAANCVQPVTTYPGRTFTFPLPDVPTGRTDVLYSVAIPSGFTYTISVEPDILTNTGLSVCVAQGTAWGLGSSATLVCTYIFY